MMNQRELKQNDIHKIQTIVEHISQIIRSPAAGLVFGLLVCIGIALYALWYSSAGHFTAFPKFSNDYIQLGEAFLQGQVSLLEQPSPELKALKNPYDYLQRENIPYHWDASYYEGKYYLYWGPVPGLVFAAAESLTHAPPFASFIVDLPYIGLSFVLLAILLLISRRYFPEAPSLSPGLFTLTALVNLPFLFLLGNPQIYHTSIIFGQFFLLLGLLGWVIYSTTTNSAWLIAAGLSWGLAIGSRINLVVSVAIYLIFALIWMVGESGWRPLWRREGALLFPLAACVIGLGIYNFARFGNPLETGQMYQLTIPAAHSSYFSTSYIPTNSYNYLFYPTDFIGKFPFIRSALFEISMLPKWISVPPAMSFDHNVFGILPSIPGLWMMGSAVPLLILAGTSIRQQGTFQPSRSSWNYYFAMVVIAGLGQLTFLLVFFFGAERYIPDFLIPLVLGTAMLVWKMDEFLKSRIRLRIVFWVIAAGLMLWTAGIGIFGGFGVPPQLFRSFNPAYYGQLASYWNDRYALISILVNRAYRILFGITH